MTIDHPMTPDRDARGTAFRRGSVDVEVPIRVRLGAPDLEHSLAEIAAGVADGTSKAVEISQSELAQIPGPPVRLMFETPSVTWGGPGKDDVRPETRARAEAALATAVARATEHLEGRVLPARLTPAVAATPGRREPRWGSLSLTRFTDLETLNRLIAEAVERWGPATGGQFYGLIWMLGDMFEILMTSGAETSMRHVTFGPLYRWELRGTVEGAAWERFPVVPPPGRAVARVVDSARDEGERLAALRKRMTSEIREALQRALPRAARTPVARYRELLEQSVEQELVRRASELPANTHSLVELRMGDEVLLLAAAEGQTWQGDAVLLPAATVLGEPAPEPSAPEDEECDPFGDEPALAELGAARRELAAQMRELAERLDISPCSYAGRFCLRAVAALRIRAFTIAEQSVRGDSEPPGRTTANRERAGNVVLVDFEPLDSPAVAALQDLAEVIPQIRHFAEDVERACAAVLPAAQRADWQTGFASARRAKLDWAVAVLFASTCRVLLLQLLIASKDALDARRTLGYAALFERTVLPRLADVEELSRLRDRLDFFARRQAPQVYPAGAAGSFPVPRDWRAARAGVTAASRPTTLHALVQGVGGGSVEHAQGVTVIRDTRGRAWTATDLGRAVIAARGFVESVDPFVKQLIDLPEFMARLRAARDLSQTLFEIVDELRLENFRAHSMLREDWTYGFRASRIVAPDGSALGGIHAIADAKLGPSAGRDAAYRSGTRALFQSGAGREELLRFVTTVGSVLLSVACPPAGFALDVALGMHQYSQAQDRETLYRGLTDPEQVLSWAEVETEYFAAELGLVLSFLPAAQELFGIGKAVASGERLTVGRAVGRRLAEDAAERLNRSVVDAFVESIVVDEVSDRALNLLLQPIMTAVEREIVRQGPVGGEAGIRSTTEAAYGAPPPPGGEGPAPR